MVWEVDCGEGAGLRERKAEEVGEYQLVSRIGETGEDNMRAIGWKERVLSGDREMTKRE